MALKHTSFDEDSPEFRKLAIDTLELYYQHFVADGTIDPRGKSDYEILVELGQVVAKSRRKRVFYMMSEGHSENLLIEARGSLKRQQYEIACLFYATWLEHWINYFIKTQAKALTEEEAKVLIRETGLKAKYQSLPPLLGMPRLSDIHISTALRIAELRNGFVHYKFVPIHMDELEKGEEHWIKDLRKAENSVKYFQSYERKYVFQGSKKLPRKQALVKGNPAAQPK